VGRVTWALLDGKQGAKGPASAAVDSTCDSKAVDPKEEAGVAPSLTAVARARDSRRLNTLSASSRGHVLPVTVLLLAQAAHPQRHTQGTPPAQPGPLFCGFLCRWVHPGSGGTEG